MKDSQGAEAIGALVTLQTSVGSIQPTSATDTGAGILAVLSGNGTGGTATITATSNGISSTATATVSCAAPTSVPATAVPQAPSTGVQPPRTGDAGLADRASSARTIAGLLLLGLALTGAAGLVWSRVRA